MALGAYTNKVCPPGAPPLLTHTVFNAYQDKPEFKCVHLIPNLYELSGFSATIANKVAESVADIRWKDRKPSMVWVGTPKGVQRKNLLSRQWVPAGLRAASGDWLHTPDYMNNTECATYKYLLDVGGTTGTTWGALQWKMASGALVFKVSTSEDAADLWHSDLKDGVHYIGVEADFSNLLEKFFWAQANDAKACAIAAAGKKIALAHTRQTALAKLAHVLKQVAY